MSAKFDKYAPQMIADLVKDFDLRPELAAAFPGNAGAESAGFTDIIEDGALAKGWAGGNGWFQWTGPRRRTFEAWLKRKGWTADSYEGNYSYLFRELKGLEGGESKIVERVRTAGTLEEATRRVCAEFERPAVNNFGPRINWAIRALTAYRANPPKSTEWSKEAETPLPVLEKELEMALPALFANPMFMQLLMGVINTAVTRVAANPGVPGVTQAATPVIVNEVVQELKKVPEIQHVTNTETHWWQQRSKWSGIIGGVAAFIGPLGEQLLGTPPGTFLGLSEGVSNLIAGGGALWSIYLAVRAGIAKKPLFTKKPDETALALQQVQAELQQLRAEKTAATKAP